MNGDYRLVRRRDDRARQSSVRTNLKANEPDCARMLIPLGVSFFANREFLGVGDWIRGD